MEISRIFEREKLTNFHSTNDSTVTHNFSKFFVILPTMKFEKRKKEKKNIK